MLDSEAAADCEFYVTPTSALDTALGTQARVSLARPRTIIPTPVAFHELAARVAECATSPI
ncbi:hypothetical protein Ssi03_27240 [Sphaerisporangium siamense]|uniref:Uncharacterized protein n=1 Tax=Sphaerisporangium siamense TaxID=795645 RepID=A0A7W7D443_9ACTN|nr:hypothetical protein [Sphaerisporangium siamense]MBB4699947.1 hypothetical protein [Sphaerisporangium siamense]GII84734.1 hypothetical protein Ssi03_27240 [Sphaerisporangium siamense]